MKAINEMNLAELAEFVDKKLISLSYRKNNNDDFMVANRLRELHSLTRWIPVEERLPSEEDVDENGEVIGYSPDPAITVTASCIPMSYHFTHWRRIDTP